jgi:NADPH:quinone reductase-like Zn-dependent oxidoreductase
LRSGSSWRSPVWAQPIDQVFALEAAADAHRYLHDRRNLGKVLLRP